jgi:predicted GNAT family N-acyltransferase
MAGGEGTIYLHAQRDAARFYTRMGFVETGKQFVEAGIVHISMILPAEAENSLLCDGGELPEG